MNRRPIERMTLRITHATRMVTTIWSKGSTRDVRNRARFPSGSRSKTSTNQSEIGRLGSTISTSAGTVVVVVPSVWATIPVIVVIAWRPVWLSISSSRSVQSRGRVATPG